MPALVDILFTRTWWHYTPGDGRWFTMVYHWFNIFEGCAWLVFAVLVIRRYLRHRQSRTEIWYSLAFAVFAITDFREAWSTTSWLLCLKLLNLIALAHLRKVVMTRHYPAARLY